VSAPKDQRETPAQATPASETSAPEIGVELYVYYRAPAPVSATVQHELQQAFAALMQARPGLHCRLLRRSDERHPDTPAEVISSPVTWMEIHQRRMGGLSHADTLAIQAALAELPPGRIGPRHAEGFSPVPDGDQNTTP
jgi:hypothetical protein